MPSAGSEDLDMALADHKRQLPQDKCVWIVFAQSFFGDF
jgi:hypothetical protein